MLDLFARPSAHLPPTASPACRREWHRHARWIGRQPALSSDSITPDRSVAGAAGEGGSGLGRVVAFTQKRLSKPNARRTIELERMFGKVFSEYDETNSIVVPLDMPFGHLRYVSEFKHSARHCKPPCHYRRRG
jgi:hypothetical protein